MKNSKALNVILPALGAVLIAVCSWISIPTVVPFTLQTFAVFAVLSILGAKNGLYSIITYIAIGAIGAPVFAGFSSGVGVLFGSTGGYILGFIFTALIYMIMTKLISDKLWVEITALVIGLFVCYAFGTAWFMFIYSRGTGPIGLATALSWCVIPFIIPDLAKLAVAVLVARKVKPATEKYRR